MILARNENRKIRRPVLFLYGSPKSAVTMGFPVVMVEDVIIIVILVTISNTWLLLESAVIIEWKH